MAKDHYPNWQKFNLESEPDFSDLDQMAIQLKLVLLALVALTGVTSDNLSRVAVKLNFKSIWEKRLAGWHTSPKLLLLDIDQARSLVLIICHLAQQNQALIRRAITLLEQLTQQNSDLREVALLRDYLDQFNQAYRNQAATMVLPATDDLTPLAIKLLVDLLFYSHPNSPQQFWFALGNQHS